MQEQVGAEGIVYFCDDDNAYDVDLFTELPYTERVSVFGVGFAGKRVYERCSVDPATGLVQGFVSEIPQRSFAIDMAGFCFSTYMLVKNQPRFSHKMKQYHLEPLFLEQLANNANDLEPLAANCTRMLAWHVRTQVRTKQAVTGEDEATYNLVKQYV